MSGGDDRNFVTEMRQVIDDATADGPYVPGVVAAEIVEKLRVNDPELLTGWLEQGAPDFVRLAINARDHSHRSAVGHRRAAAAFSDAVDAHQAGDSGLLRSRFLEMRFTVGDGSRRPLGDLTKSDLEFVADTYQDRVDQNALRVEFMRALAAKVGKGPVRAKFTEDQVAAMFDSLAA